MTKLLSGQTLELQGSYAGATIECCDIKGARQADLRGAEVLACKADGQEIDLSGAKVRDCIFFRCKLTLTGEDFYLENNDFIECEFIGAGWPLLSLTDQNGNAVQMNLTGVASGSP